MVVLRNITTNCLKQAHDNLKDDSLYIQAWVYIPSQAWKHNQVSLIDLIYRMKLFG